MSDNSLNKFKKYMEYAEHALFAYTIIKGANYIRQNGIKDTIGSVIDSVVSSVPGANTLLEAKLQDEVKSTMATMFKENEESSTVPLQMKIPNDGIKRNEIVRRLKALGSLDVNYDKGEVFALVYAIGDESDHKTKNKKNNKSFEKMGHFDFLNQIFCMSACKNALNPTVFPSLRRIECEVLAMSTNLLNGNELTRGTMTSGGTESILCAVKSYRDRSIKLFGVKKPNLVIPITGHPAFHKACHMFQVEARVVNINPKTRRANVQEMINQIDKNTICLVASAPQYPHGVIDPIEEISAIAIKKKIPFHVDACIGGWMLPWLEKLGYKIPLWDFRVAGVTSISADIHKYGYALKGASVLLFRSEHYRKFQFYAWAGWPGGLFVSPGVLGSRGGGSIAAAWASLLTLGEKGFLKKAKASKECADQIANGIEQINGLRLVAKPDMTIVSFMSDDKNVNIFALADRIEDEHGFKMERQANPDSIHLSIMPVHVGKEETILESIKVATAYVREHPELANEGSAATYGMAMSIPSGSILEDFLVTFMGEVYHMNK